MSLPYRVKLAFFAAPVLLTMSLAAPSLGQARAQEGTQSAKPRAPTVHHHLHRSAYIVCDTPDVHACHKEFGRRHGAQAH
jgi:hypothetical protein